MSLGLSVSVCQSVCLSTYLEICLSPGQVHLSPCFSLSLALCLSFSVCLSYGLHLSVYNCMYIWLLKLLTDVCKYRDACVCFYKMYILFMLSVCLCVEGYCYRRCRQDGQVLGL